MSSGARGLRERLFLERSLADLEQEREAGDLTEADYRRLRADYERRLRGEAPPPRPPPRPALVVASVAFVVVVALAAGVLVARSIGRRAPGDTITGGVPVSSTATTAAPSGAARCAVMPASDAIDCFTAYTQANPEDPDGWVQFGLFSINAGISNGSDRLLDAGETFLRRALELDPDDLEARVYLAVVLERTGQAAAAAEACASLTGADLPADLQPLVDLAC